jgi:hypothetical protein
MFFVFLFYFIKSTIIRDIHAFLNIDRYTYVKGFKLYINYGIW